MRTKISGLVETARKYGNAEASDGRWRARVMECGCIKIKHYETNMLLVLNPKCGIGNGKEVAGISPGHGSVSDKQGINKILKSIGVYNETYNTLFPEQSKKDNEPDTYVKPEPVESFNPPLRARDTIGL